MYVFSRFIMETLLKLGFLEFTHSVYYYRVVFFLLPFVHAIFNPIVYFAMSRNFRQLAVRKLTRCPPCRHS